MEFFAKRLRRDEDGGFTLIELMVVVLIIAILIAIAIPTFLGARKRAQDRAAQSGLRNALTGAKTLFTDQETYASATVTALGESEPSLCFSNGTTTANSCSGTVSDDPKEIFVDSGSIAAANVATHWAAGAYSKSGKCFWIRDKAGPTSSTTGLGTTYDSTDSVSSCTAATAGKPDPDTDADWSAQW